MTDHREERRRHQRYAIGEAGALWIQDQAFDCTVVNISAGGALVEVDPRAAPGESVRLEIPNWGNFEAVVRRRERQYLALTFLPD